MSLVYDGKKLEEMTRQELVALVVALYNVLPKANKATRTLAGKFQKV